MKYYIIAGEASGDLHGSRLISELKKADASAIVRCWGGDKMKAAGGEVVKHISELAFMGFTEVIKNLPTILRNIKYCKKDILSFKPDALILIDYPGFNLRIAKWAKKQGLKVIYYISPQVWAWKESRVAMMKKCIDKMLVILPFEKEFFKKNWDWDVEYVGHPLVDTIDEFKSQHAKDNDSLIPKDPIALLPGSRKQEIAKKLPVMLEVSRSFPHHQFIIGQAPAVDDRFYKKFTSDYPNVGTVKDRTYELLMNAKAAIVTSGTATLETALFGVPEVVCYKGSYVSYQIGKRLVKVKYIAMVNLIMDRLVVKELIQNDFTIENCRKELELLLNDDAYRNRMQKDFQDLKTLLKNQGNASAKAAFLIFEYLQSRNER